MENSAPDHAETFAAMSMMPSVALRYQGTQIPSKLPSGAGVLWQKFCRRAADLRCLTIRLKVRSKQVHQAMGKLTMLSEDQFRQSLQQVRDQVRVARKVSASLERQAFAHIGEASRRVLGMAPYRVQFMASLALWRGILAEMATGEGKTLSASVAVVFCAWRGKPVHLLTSNDYLAERDCIKMQPLLEYCGVSSASVTEADALHARSPKYACDVVYTTGKNLLGDFLRDRLMLGFQTELPHLVVKMLAGDLPAEGPVMRGIHTVLVDEADSVLIDDSVTPLIISRKIKDRTVHQAVTVAYHVAATFNEGRDFEVDYRRREISFTRSGEQAVVESIPQMPPFYRTLERTGELVVQALMAKYFFLKGVDYVVQEDKVVIVDLPTGRLKTDSTWQHGLHQAVEMKEGLPLTEGAETMASMSFQNFFRLFPKLGGLTGTARKAEPEFWRVYGLKVVRIPTHRPCIRKNLSTCYLATLEEKEQAILDEIKVLHEQRRPVLVGVNSVESSVRLSRALQKLGIAHELLNAEKHAEEAEIVARAGHLGAITIATNMAGRGTDISLAKGVAELGGLHVIACEKMDSARTDRQLEGRAARQGDPGSVRRFVSMQDENLRRAFPEIILNRVGEMLRLRVPGARLFATILSQRAQRRHEYKARLQREGVIRRDRWLEESLPFKT